MSTSAQLKRVFLLASEAPPDRREAILDEWCAGDADLRREVVQLLKSDEQTGFELSVPLLQQPAMLSEISLTGRSVGPYVLRELIGKGGMGSVYLADRCDDAFQKRVAVKLVPATIVSRQAEERLRRERQVLANLEHPYIARLLDGGLTEFGAMYLVMEYIEGVTLTEFCLRRQLRITDRIELFLRVCEAVSFAHRNLVVHRDLKPENVLVTSDGHPHLLDFGIAKLLTDSGESDTSLTQTGYQPLTPQYASPEQVSGLPVSTATDVYSLGLILYEMLADSRPYIIESRSRDELIRVVCKVSPRPMNSGATAKVPADLEAIVMKAIRKEPDLRYGSADALSNDLRRYVGGQPVDAVQGTLRYRLTKFLRRNRLAAAAGSLIALALLLGAGTTTWQARIADGERIRAEHERGLAQQQATEAKQQQARAEDLARREKSERDRAERNALEAEAQRRQALDQQQKADARFRDIRALSTSFLFEFDAAITDITGAEKGRSLVVSKGLEYLDKLSKDSGNDESLQAEIASAYERLGDIQGNIYLSNQGQFRKALELYERAMKIRKRLAEQRPDDQARTRALAFAYLRLADGMYTGGDIKPSIGHHAAALHLLTELQRDGDESQEVRTGLHRLHSRLCTILIPHGDLDGSLASCLLAVDISRDLVARDPGKPALRAGLAVAWSGLASWHRARKEFPKAIELLESAATEFAQLFAASPQNSGYGRNTAGAYTLIGDSWAALGERRRGIEYHQRSLNVLRALLKTAPDDVRLQTSFGFACIRLAPVLMAEGRGDEARATGQDGLEVFRTLAERPDATADDFNNYAGFLLEIGVPALQNPALALTWAKRATAKVPNPSLPLRDTLAQAYCETGDYAAAIRTAEEALHLTPASQGSGGLRAEVESKLAKYRAGACK